MAYATIADVESVIGADTLRSIADHDGDHVRDDAVVTEALENASAVAESYLDDELPIAIPAPRSLKRAVIAIAVNDLREARDIGTESSRLNFSSAMKWLEAISAGKATLSPGQGDTEGGFAVDPGDPETSGLARVWSRDSARRIL